MEKLPAPKLYRIGLSLLGMVIVIAIVLHYFERSLFTAHEVEVAPATSPLSEVEFESGKISKDLSSKQRKELTAYSVSADSGSSAGESKDYVSVPIERAFDQMLEGNGNSK
jgi:hypothetical protein